jgi:hypothetical protein
MNALTELEEGLSISWAAIRANKMRSVLTRSASSSALSRSR